MLKEYQDAFHYLAMALMNVNPELRHQGIGGGKLGEEPTAGHELADCDDADAEPGQGEDTAAEQADGDDALRRHGNAVRSILEWDVKKGKAEDGRHRLVFVSPAFPLFLCREKGPAMGRGEGPACLM